VPLIGTIPFETNDLGHATYEIDTDVYRKLIETFGDDIVDRTNRSIQRKVLATKVFQSPIELKKLTDIVWPAILKLVEQRIEAFSQEGTDKCVCVCVCVFLIVVHRLGRRVIVLDAAVLLEAKWTVAVNEVWIASIPPKEVGHVLERSSIESIVDMFRLFNVRWIVTI
jgi:phosphopantetheine adenylyltransferase / dephospho-CoA kinase